MHTTKMKRLDLSGNANSKNYSDSTGIVTHQLLNLTCYLVKETINHLKKLLQIHLKSPYYVQNKQLTSWLKITELDPLCSNGSIRKTNTHSLGLQ